MAITKKVVKTLRKIRDKKRQNDEIKDVKARLKDLPGPGLNASQKAEIKAYWAKLGFDNIPTCYHELFYKKSGLFRADYVPGIVFYHYVWPRLNENGFVKVWREKSYLDMYIGGKVKAPFCVVRCINSKLCDNDYNLITKEEANALMSKYDLLLSKPSLITRGGKRVETFSGKEMDIDTLIGWYGTSFVVQVPVKQHVEMNKFNDTSVNCVRVYTCMLEDGVHVMNVLIKVGEKGQFADNFGDDRYLIGVDVKTGKFLDFCTDLKMNKFYSIPSGYDFKGQPLPFYDKIIDCAKKAHSHMPHFGMVYWDICVNEEGEPVVIEANLRHTDMLTPQVTCAGPFFGEYNKEMVEAARNRKKVLF